MRRPLFREGGLDAGSPQGIARAGRGPERLQFDAT